MESFKNMKSNPPLRPEDSDALDIFEATASKLKAYQISEHHEKPYHNENHVLDVERAATDILAIFEKYALSYLADKEWKEAVKIVALGHDSILKASEITDPDDPKYGTLVRERGWEPGKNEYESALKIISTLEEQGECPDSLKEKIMRLTEVTVPIVSLAEVTDPEYLINDTETNTEVDLRSHLFSFGTEESPEYKALMIDQSLNKDSHIAELAIGMGDLSAAGRMTMEEFFTHGMAEFRETNPVIEKELESGINQLPAKRKVKIASDMLNFIKAQVGFVLMQKRRFEKILAENTMINNLEDSDSIKKNFYDLYPNFDRNVIKMADIDNQVQIKYFDLVDISSYPENDNKLAKLAELVGYTKINLKAEDVN